MTTGNRELRWVLRVNELAAYAGAVLVAALFVGVVRSGWLLSAAVPILALGLALRFATRALDRDDATTAIRLHAAATWVVGIWVTLVVPFIWPTLMLTVLMPLQLAITWVRRDELVRLAIASVVVVSAVAICGVTEAATGLTDQVDPWSPWVRHLVVVATLTAVFVMVLVISWQQHAVSEARTALVQQSRARLASVADDERRRIERDLHDGAQQRLVGLAVRLGLLSAQLDGDHAAAVDTMTDELADAIDELRELAHGIYPPLLANEGVGPALRAAGRRSPLATHVRLADDGRWPADVETALYFCGLEAMQNAAKHAGPDATITVRLERDATGVALTVTDDGPGLDPTAQASGGLLNMQDRVGAVGGTVEIGTAPEGGVEVRACVPAVPIG